MTTTTEFPLNPDALPVFLFFQVPEIKRENEKVILETEILSVLRATGATNIIITDATKTTWSSSTYADAMSLDYIKYKRYQATIFDCEDFADVMLGEMRVLLPNSCFGRVDVDIVDKVTGSITGAHALNFILDDELTLYYVEPQTGGIVAAFLVPNYYPRFFYV